MSESEATSTDFFLGTGEMANLIRDFEWEKSSLGSPAQWPESLKVSLQIILHSPYPMFIFWGPDLIMFHNDAYKPVLGKKYPNALGKSAREVWGEIWDDIGEMVSGVMAGREVYAEDLLLYLERKEFPEETYWTFSYSPIYNTDGTVGGLFCACNEQTRKILQQRRLQTLIDISDISTQNTNVKELLDHAICVLEDNPKDIPFAAIYQVDNNENEANLYAYCGLSQSSLIFDNKIKLDEKSSLGWDFQNVNSGKGIALRTGLLADFASELATVELEVDRAAIIPITNAAEQNTAAVLICGISPYLEFDKDYADFLKIASTNISRAKTDIRSHEIALERARALAEIDEAKTAFFSNVSHEFRTPLTLMLGPLEELIEASGSNGKSEHLNLIYRNGQRLQKLVNNLLDFSRLEAGRARTLFQRTDITALTRDLASHFQSAMQKAGLTYTLELEEIPQEVYVDREKWEIIVLNLISNAFKFTLEGEVAVRLHSEKGEVKLTVSDTGTGISKENLDLVFKRFHRVGDVKARTQEGSGIGLAVVQELVNMHGGRTALESEENRGSVFTVFLPTGRKHLPQDKISDEEASLIPTVNRQDFVDEAFRWIDTNQEPESEPFAGPWPEQAEGQAKLYRVLVAEDNIEMRNYLMDILREKYQVYAVENGAEALTWVQKGLDPDLVLTDVMMPELDGFGLLDAIKNDEETSHIPVILLSARAGEEAHVEGLQHGADDYLSKPFSARELVARVDARIEISVLRSAAERQARQGEERLRAMIMQAPVAMAILREEELTFDIANDAYLEIAGKTAEQIMHKPLLEAMPEVKDQPVYEAITGVYRDGKTLQALEFPVELNRHGQYETVYFNFVYEPMRDIDGRVNGIMAVAVDVSPQVKARLLLEKQEQYFRNMANDVPVMIWMMDAEGNCTYLNKQWFEYTGQTKDESLGTSWLKATHPDDRAELQKEINAALAKPRYFEVIYRLRNRDGYYQWHMDAGMPRYDHEGKIEGFTGAVINIHERKLAEDALKQNESELRSAISATNLGTWVYYPITGEFNWSERSKELFGFSPETRVDLEVFINGLHPDDREQVLQAIKNAVDPDLRSPYNIEFRAIGENDGKQRWIKASGQPHFNEYNVADYFIGTLLDITEHKALEKQKDDFIIIASHELKTPVTSIKGYIQMIAEDFERKHEYEAVNLLHIADRQVDKLISLINELLDATKIEAGELQFNKDVFNFDELIQEVVSSMQYVTSSHKIIFDGHTGKTVFGDKNRIEQLVVNLISNAIKFSPGKEEIQVSIGIQQDQVTLKVEDFGVGIPANKINNIFERFYRDEQTSQWSTGLGLGLFISSDIIKRHNGTIRVESEPDKGSVFHVSLPYHN